LFAAAASESKLCGGAISRSITDLVAASSKMLGPYRGLISMTFWMSREVENRYYLRISVINSGQSIGSLCIWRLTKSCSMWHGVKSYFRTRSPGGWLSLKYHGVE
jgi:hypothetical protein